MENRSHADRAAAIAALRDPTRRALFDVVAGSGASVSVDEAVRATGIPKSTAALHLDRLVEVGVLMVGFERRNGRTGPGAGRPAKVYRAAATEVAASIPARDYELMGEVFAGALEAAETGSRAPAAVHEVVHDAVRASAAARGAQLIREHGAWDRALTAVGYAPVTGDDGVTNLTNCPFHRLVGDHADLVCGANLALVSAMVAGEGQAAVLAPAAGRCCVQLVPSASGRATRT